jgi:hypothetical protein
VLSTPLTTMPSPLTNSCFCVYIAMPRMPASTARRSSPRSSPLPVAHHAADDASA